MIQSVTRQSSELRNEQSFTMIYDQVSTFCKNNSIDLAAGGKVRRVKSVPSRFKDVIITSTIGHRDHLNSEAKYRTNLYFPLIDSMLVELKDRFSEKSINVVNGINALCPESDNFLQAEFDPRVFISCQG